MIEDAQEIFQYLPISFRNETEQEYINFLWEVFTLNYKEQKYQFAFLAYHMLFMCFVYFEIWQIMCNNRADFEKALVGFNKDKETNLIKASSPFTLTEVDESIVFRFLKLIGMDNSDIGKCTRIVRDRNNVAHSNGNIFYKDELSLNRKIDEILGCIEMIQDCSEEVLEACYQQFLFESNNPMNREFLNNEDQIREVLIHGNYLSRKDILFLKTFDEHAIEFDILSAEMINLAQTLRQMDFGEE